MNVRVVLLSVGVVGLLGSIAAAADDRWPQFRGPGNLGVSEESGLPESWSTTENVAWVADIPGLGWSSPIVWGPRRSSSASTACSAVPSPSRSSSRWWYLGTREPLV